MTSHPVRVRFCPAPSGVLHVGSARTALYNWLHARGHDGVFVFRIEDTDAARATEESVRSMTAALRWLGLDWDEGPEVGGPYGPYRQSQRAALYAAVTRRLVAAGVAYEDHATAEELGAYRAAAREAGRPPVVAGPVRPRAHPGDDTPPSIRVRTPTAGAVVVEDYVRGRVTFDWANLGDFVVQRADGSATYPLANAVDDLAQGIALVCRGEDLLSVTPRQVLLYDVLTADHLLDDALAEAGLPARDGVWAAPTAFAHLSMIVGADRHKLSKRHGSVAVQEFERRGYLPEVLVNYLALLGWGPADGRERLSVDELVAEFDLARVGKTAAAFDADKLTAFNGERIRALPAAELADRLVPFLDGRHGPALTASPPTAAQRRTLAALVPIVQERMERLDDVQRYAPAFFRDKIELDPASADKVLGAAHAVAALTATRDELAALAEWRADTIEAALRPLAERLGIGFAKVAQPVRVAVTGSSVSPPLFDSLAILPRELVVERIDAAIPAAQARQPA